MNKETNYSKAIIGAAINVHRKLGPGKAQSIYEKYLCKELASRGFSFGRQVPLSLWDQKTRSDDRFDVVVGGSVALDLNGGQSDPYKEVRLKKSLTVSNIKMGFLLNFNVSSMKSGIKRIVREKAA